MQALALGLRHFGENRVQDAGRKFAEPLPDGAELHLIGQLQSNKARPAVALFDIDRVGRPPVADRRAGEGSRAPRRSARRSCSRSTSRASRRKPAAIRTARRILMARLVASPWLVPRGLMTMAPLVADPEAVRPVFAGLRTLARSSSSASSPRPISAPSPWA